MSVLSGWTQGLIAPALDAIIAEGYNVIYCSITGVRVGTLDNEAVVETLRVDLSRDPFATVDDLVELFATRHQIICSQPAPSLRYFRDHDELVRVLRHQTRGPASLFCYLTGRLFFDSFIREKDVDSSLNRAARLQFLRDMQARFDKLPAMWYQSLTPQDEDVKLSSTITRIFDVVAGVSEPSILDESKAAQRCLESMLRLDAIFNLRSTIYDPTLKAQLLLFRDSDEWTFSEFALLLDKLESNSIITQRKRGNSVAGNAMVLSSALAAIGWSQTRISRLREYYEKEIEKGADELRVKHIFKELEVLGFVEDKDAASPELDENDIKRVKQIIGQLPKDLSLVSWSERRLDAAERVMQRRAGGEGQVRQAVRPGLSFAKKMLDSGMIVDPAMRKKIEAAVDASKIRMKKKAAGLDKEQVKKDSGKGNPNRKLFSGMAAAFGEDTLSKLKVGGLDKPAKK